MTKPPHGRRAAAKPTSARATAARAAIARTSSRTVAAVKSSVARAQDDWRPAADALASAFRAGRRASGLGKPALREPGLRPGLREAGLRGAGLRAADAIQLPHRFARLGAASLAIAAVGGLAFVTSVPTVAVDAMLQQAEVAEAGAAAVSGDSITAAASAALDQGYEQSETQTVEVSSSVAQAAAVGPGAYAVQAAPPPVLSEVAGLGTVALTQAKQISWPVVDPSRTSSGFGPRSAPCSGCSTYHDGIDFTPGNGTPVLSIAEGVVVLATENGGGLGVNVEVQHNVDGQIVTSSYAHMQYGSLAVGVGQHVTAGQQLGLVGTTGQSTGPHLHLEMFGTDGVRFDGMAWLRARLG